MSEESIVVAAAVVAVNDGLQTPRRNKTFKNDATTWKLVFGHGAVLFALDLTIFDDNKTTTSVLFTSCIHTS